MDVRYRAIPSGSTLNLQVFAWSSACHDGGSIARISSALNRAAVKVQCRSVEGQRLRHLGCSQRVDYGAEGIEHLCTMQCLSFIVTLAGSAILVPLAQSGFHRSSLTSDSPMCG